MKNKAKVAILLTMVLVMCSFGTAFAGSDTIVSEQPEAAVQPLSEICPLCMTGTLHTKIYLGTPSP